MYRFHNRLLGGRMFLECTQELVSLQFVHTCINKSGDVGARCVIQLYQSDQAMTQHCSKEDVMTRVHCNSKESALTPCPH